MILVTRAAQGPFLRFDRSPEPGIDGHAPHVAGGAALYKATHPSATPAEVKSALQNAGNLNWNDAADPDPIKETLLNVGSF